MQEEQQKIIAELQEMGFGAALECLNQIHQASSGSGCPLPDALVLDEIVEVPGVFQVRCSALNEDHLTTLQEVLSRHGRFKSPVTLWRCGPLSILIDGHHRIEALRRASEKLAPVEWFQGDVHDALKKAAAENFVAKLGTTLEQRCDFAWKLTLYTDKSKATVAREADINERTVANMRAAKKFLGPDRAMEMSSWDHARGTWQREKAGLVDAEVDQEWIDKKVERYRSRMVKAHGTPRYYENEIAALGLKAYYGRHAFDVARQMLDTLGYQVILKDMDGNIIEPDVEDGLEDLANTDF